VVKSATFSNISLLAPQPASHCGLAIDVAPVLLSVCNKLLVGRLCRIGRDAGAQDRPRGDGGADRAGAITIADHVVDKLTQHRDVGSLSYPDMEVGALGSAAKKIRLCALVAPHQQPSMPAPADLAAPVTDVPHLIRITMPMSPKLRVGADLNGVHAFWNRERLDLRAHVCGSSSRPSPS
jgi:hypothetical protein